MLVNPDIQSSTSADILLCTLNSRYSHTSFGLRYLYANLEELQARARILEFDINQNIFDLVERVLLHNPKILGLGIYIWNVKQSLELLSVLRRLRPDITVVLGGPEVSFEIESQPIVSLADYVIAGEADHEFRELCRELLAGRIPDTKIRRPAIPDLDTIKFPYDLYTKEDIEHRIVYVEASRGCPFTCEFCLSSLDIPVRQFELATFLEAMDLLYKKGLRRFKFVDRTFNLNPRTSKAILDFFLARITPDLFVHFEMVPDRLPQALRDIIVQFPAGSLQFEVGIQSFDPEVGKLISRRQDFTKIEENIKFLRSSTGVHIHADLIVGLPGESMESFALGFNRLVDFDPQEIQVGILKRLRGAPIARHDFDWAMVYCPNAPYEVLSTKLMDFLTIQRMQRFSRYWDLVSNSGRFQSSRRLLWRASRDPFRSFLAFSDWLGGQVRRRHGIALKELARLCSYI